MKLGAVVVHHRAWPAVAATLRALLGGTRPPDRTVVVDNASGAGVPDAIRSAFPEVDVVEAAANRGPAAAMNLGAGHLTTEGTEAVLFLTSDCLLAPPALAHLEQRLRESPAVGAVGPLLGRASRPEEVFSAGGFIDGRTWDPGHHRHPSRLEDWAGAGPRRRAWLDGACVLVRAQALADAGPLDEQYFHYFDDVDHHLRLGARGWQIECVPAAVAWQEPGPISAELWVRNRLRFLARHAPRRVLVRELARQARGAMVDLRGDDRDRAGARVRAAASFAARRWGPIAQR